MPSTMLTSASHAPSSLVDELRTTAPAAAAMGTNASAISANTHHSVTRPAPPALNFSRIVPTG